MFRKLNETETAEFKAWARANYKPGSAISPIWHPVVQNECDAMNYEAAQAAKK
jgi:hypothetical protein